MTIQTGEQTSNGVHNSFKPLLLQGMTFRIDNGELVIARILHGGMIDQQGLLHVGDIIKEVNAKDVGDDPRVLQEMLQEASGSIVLKVLPSYQEPHPPKQVAIWSLLYSSAWNFQLQNWMLFRSFRLNTPPHKPKSQSLITAFCTSMQNPTARAFNAPRVSTSCPRLVSRLDL